MHQTSYKIKTSDIIDTFHDRVSKLMLYDSSKLD